MELISKYHLLTFTSHSSLSNHIGALSLFLYLNGLQLPKLFMPLCNIPVLFIKVQT